MNNKLVVKIFLLLVSMGITWNTNIIHPLSFGQNKVNYVEFNWKVYKTEHFEIYFYQGVANRIPEIATVAEKAYKKISKDINFELEEKVPLILYKVRREFEQTNVIPQFIPRGVAAFARLFLRRIVVPVDGPRTRLHKTITHEIVHIFQYDILYHFKLSELSPVPQWLMEGYAEHESEDWDTSGKMVLRDAVINSKIYSMEQLESFYVPNVYLAYKESQSLIDFIVQKKGQKAIQDIFHQLGKKYDKSDSFAAIIKETLGWDLSELHKYWVTYLKKEFFPMITLAEGPEDELVPLVKNKKNISDKAAIFSPTGQIIAFLSNRKRSHMNVNHIYLANAETGEIFSCLTKDFYGNKYEYIMDEGKPLSWSPDSNYIAFIGRNERGSSLFIIDIRTEKLHREYDLEANNVTSPVYLPNGKEILFAGYLNGQSDLFLIDIQSGSVSQVTYDQYIDETPSIDSTGSIIYYSSERGKYYKIFRINLDNLQEQEQITHGNWNDRSPQVCDDKCLVYYSDRNGIFNLYVLDFTNYRTGKLTDTLGGFVSPVCSPDKKYILFSGYSENRFQVYRKKFPEPQFMDENWVGEKKFHYPGKTMAQNNLLDKNQQENNSINENLKLVKAEKIKFKLYPNVVNAGISTISSGYIVTSATIMMTDLFNDHNLFYQGYTINRLNAHFFEYVYIKKRTDYFFNFFNLNTYDFGFDEAIRKDLMGSTFGFRYPFNRYKRFDFAFSFYEKEYPRDETFKLQNPEFYTDRKVAQVDLAYIVDRTRFSYFGPVSGFRSNFGMQYSFALTDSYAQFTNFFVDLRGYLQLSDRSLLATRVSLASSHGDDREIFFIGGAGTIYIDTFGTIRGFEFGEIAGPATLAFNAELRFPFIDLILFAPGIGLGEFRGKIFVDTGFANIKDVKQNREINGARFLDNDNIINISSVGMGFSWNLGVFTLNFDYARITDFQRFYGGTVFQFWIGREF